MKNKTKLFNNNNTTIVHTTHTIILVVQLMSFYYFSHKGLQQINSIAIIFSQSKI